MDLGAEEAFKQRLAGVLAGRTLVVVTHRDSMLSIVDKLVVMDAGRVVAAGPKALRLGSVRLDASYGARRVDLRNLFGSE